jgi:hypothetical protein
LGLTHLSLLDELKPEICSAGAMPLVLRLVVYNKNALILVQCCKLIASLALHPPNQNVITSSGVFHGIIDLIDAVSTGADKNVRRLACAACCNIIFHSDANRVLAVELDCIPPLLGVIQYMDVTEAIINACRAIANIAYLNSFTAARILSLGGDVIIVDMLSSHDIVSNPVLNAVACIAIANMCNSESNQSHLGATKNLVNVVGLICSYSK